MMIIYVNKKYLCIYVCMYVWIYKEISLIISNVFPSNYSFFLFVVWSLNCVRPALCESMDCSMPGFPVLHYLPDFAQTHVHWVGDTIQPSHPLLASFSSCPQSFPESGSFPMSWLFALGGQSIGVLVSASVLPMTIQGWYPLGLTGLIAKELSGVFSSITVQKHHFSLQSTNKNPFVFLVIYLLSHLAK